MMNVRIDPCNQSGETVMGRRAVMRLILFQRVSGREQRESVGDLRWIVPGCRLTIRAHAAAHFPDEHGQLGPETDSGTGSLHDLCWKERIRADCRDIASVRTAESLNSSVVWPGSTIVATE